MTHWKKLQNPDYLGAYALEPGQELTATMKSVRREMVTGPDGKKEECTVAYFAEKDIKPFILNTTNAKTIEKIYKTPYIEAWAGKAITLYVEKVKAFGETVDALRIRPYIPKAAQPVPPCADCQKDITGYGSMSAAQLAAYTNKKYDRPLCAECAERAKGANGASEATETETIKEDAVNEG